MTVPISIRLSCMAALAAGLLVAQPAVQLEKLEGKTTLLFTPHPDDDTFCCTAV